MADYTSRQPIADHVSSASATVTPSPGKHTLVEQAHAKQGIPDSGLHRTIQCRNDAAPGAASPDMTAPLPRGNLIQRVFGRHDTSATAPAGRQESSTLHKSPIAEPASAPLGGSGNPL